MKLQSESRKSIKKESKPRNGGDFSIGLARLWEENNIADEENIYAVGVTYKDTITEKSGSIKSGTFRRAYIKNGHVDKPVNFVAVKYINHGKRPELHTAEVTFQVYPKKNEEKTYTSWTLLTDPVTFLDNHQKHVGLLALSNSSPMRRLLKQKRELELDAINGDKDAQTKADKINCFLKTMSDSNTCYGLNILNNPENELYKALVKPRIKTHRFLFFKFRFQWAKTDKETSTFSILQDLKRQEFYKNLKTEEGENQASTHTNGA
ncbi:MAG: hypothetical protein H0U71_08355 [Gammaproteobacteria bacterium]|nr:hypothetical protein [Gammaproteobacteria bacterium]